jgi:hypothetical protein
MRRSVVVAVPVVLVATLVTAGWLADDNGTPGTAADVIWLLSFGTFALVGGVVVGSRPGNAIGWLFLFAGLGTAVATMLDQLSRFLGAGWLSPASLVLFGLAWLAATTYPLFLFPDGRLPSRRWRPVIVVLCLFAVAQSIAVVAGLWSAVRVFEFASLAFAALGVVALVRRWRRSGGVVRQQLSWLALGGLVIVVAYLTEALLVSAFGHSVTRGALVEAAVVATIPIATALAILRHRLLDIETRAATLHCVRCADRGGPRRLRRIARCRRPVLRQQRAGRRLTGCQRTRRRRPVAGEGAAGPLRGVGAVRRPAPP